MFNECCCAEHRLLEEASTMSEAEQQMIYEFLLKSAEYYATLV